jgi:hypothetical protein
MAITLEEAKLLRYGDILIYKTMYIDGKMKDHRWKVNGKAITWKRNKDRVKVPLKHGLFDYGYLTEKNLHLFSFPEDFFMRKVKKVIAESKTEGKYQLIEGEWVLVNVHPKQGELF